MLREILSAGIMTFGLVGCVYHLDTAVPDDILRSNPGLIGTWVSEDSTQAVITAAEDQFYHLQYRQKNAEPSSFHGRVGRLGEHEGLEVWPAYGAVDESWPTGRFLVIIDVRPGEITTWSLNTDSIKAAVERDGAEMPHLIYNGDIILTAPTSALVKNLTEYLRRPGYVADETVWRRANSQ
jgi:hypothetical protein